ncbi:hypothetical protein DICPUDRAFT_150380 [Dictyostelium purpureum]|uniref:Uncharacterized protein n=1 Tax=Dictyostelium purpureum TaxID=5786 RepID=F0ZG65_DICPU|nr:uncharacterized protein DICPUDRAFT_150380 [Dictyostelium purpureum]EGC37067.1 hypothetical protein DICPUDRAFT_150380 [Dictyostelium purpureum]|eukprot:XP_003286424.1 hypothetical protein DICPUDRAFT_150380 [Dictyostelium purpureum]
MEIPSNIINNNNNHDTLEIIFENTLLINLLNKYFNKNGLIYYKFKHVYARQTRFVGEFIETITNDGLETKNSTKSTTDYIVKNRTAANEQYILSNHDFNDRYEWVEDVRGIQDSAGFEWSLYKPKSTSQIKAIKVNKKILIYLINQHQQEQQQQKKRNCLLHFINNIKLKNKLKKYKFYLIAQWGEKMVFKENDFLVVPINLTPNIYRIANKEFFETYKKQKNK